MILSFGEIKKKLVKKLNLVFLTSKTFYKALRKKFELTI